jgi:hypothetical protein
MLLDPLVAVTARPQRTTKARRLMCKILDYRYARYVSGDAEMIHPFIHRGLSRDVRLWKPAIDDSAARGGDGAPRRATRPRCPWCSRSTLWSADFGLVPDWRSAARRSVRSARSASSGVPFTRGRIRAYRCVAALEPEARLFALGRPGFHGRIF